MALPEKVGERLLDVGKVSLVVGENDIVLVVQNSDLHGRGADVDSQGK